MNKIILITRAVFCSYMLIATSGCKKQEIVTPAENEVLLLYKMFNPSFLSVKKGTTVTFTNKDNANHTVASGGGLFQSGKIKSDESFTFTFNDAGTYYFFCNYHESPQEQGTIVVQ